MKFLDSNVLVYAFFVPRRVLSLEELQLKEKSKKIIEKIDVREKIAISVVHLSEVANILRTCFTPVNLVALFESLYSKENVTIIDVTQTEYLGAVHLSKSFNGKINDCLAVVLMRKYKISEIYTFDADFKRFSEIKILQE